MSCNMYETFKKRVHLKINSLYSPHKQSDEKHISTAHVFKRVDHKRVIVEKLDKKFAYEIIMQWEANDK